MAISNIRLNIETKQAKLELSIQRPVLDMQSTPAELTINNQPAVVEITSRPYGKLEIDQSPCRASMGIKDFDTFARDAAALGKQAVMECIARLAQEGDRMAAIETNEDVIANIAFESAVKEGPTISWEWKEPPNIRYTPNPVRFEPKPGQFSFSAVPGRVDYNYQPGKVETRLSQYPSIRFWTTGDKIDTKA